MAKIYFDASKETDQIPILVKDQKETPFKNRIYKNQENSAHISVTKNNSSSISKDSQRELRNENEEIPSENLIKNWDLSEIPVPPEALSPFFVESQPASIVYFNGETPKRIYPKQYAAGSAQSDKTLYLSSKEYIHKLALEQSKPAIESSNENKSDSENENRNSENTIHLPSYSYDIASFSPGTRYNGSVLIPVADDLRRALNGPDYSFDNYNSKDKEQRIAHLSNVLPLGNNGSIILQIRSGGTIQANSGSSFAVYQTTFPIEGTDIYWHKFAHLGISETLNPKQVKWFPCEPDSGNIKTCVGSIPTSEGGDHFNISEIGLSKARYIWIKDIGNNKDYSNSEWPTEGCAIDALRIYQAYVTK